jgi:EAL domain-containing protein (putative c-di-GMP-specific phosphodiesterase class I)
MGEDALDDVRRIVVDDRQLRDRLLGAPDRRAFIAEVVDVARERGIELTAEEVAGGLRSARLHRQERWV